MSSSSIWLWKQEPASPSVLCESETWYDASDTVAIAVESGEGLKISRAEQATKLLQDLDQWVKEEEPFPDWLEEKIDLPIFDDLPPPPSLMTNLDIVGLKPPSATPLVSSPILDMVSLKHAPLMNAPHALNTVPMKVQPQPPILNSTMDMNMNVMKPAPQSLLPLSPVQYHIPPPPQPVTMPLQQTQTQPQTPVMIQEFDYSLGTHDTLTPPESPRETDLVFTMLQEMQPHELDELVRMRVESLVESPASNTPVCLSPRSSVPEECESVSSPCSDSSYSDPEWSMPCSSSDLKSSRKRRLSKPYSRTPPEEKKLRKKEQNKNAATRYRMKKKQEIEEILGEEKQLQQKNEHLKSELTELGREIKYLRNLMRDMFRAKGLIK